MNFVRPGFRKLSPDIQTDRQTESTEIIKHAASRVVSNAVVTNVVDSMQARNYGVFGWYADRIVSFV